MLTKSVKSVLEFLMPRSRVLVLAFLLSNTEAKWYLRELARRTGLSAPTVQNEANGLVDAGIIVRERSGNRVYYRANPHCPIYPDLRMLIIKTVGVADEIKKALEPLAGKIRLAYVYGSFADGTANADSDVDVMVVGPVASFDAVGALADAEDVLRREVNATVYSVKEYKARLAEAEGFIYEVHNGPRLILLGDADEFE